MSTRPAGDDRNAEVAPLLAAAARSDDTCIGCGDPELVTEDLCADCLEWLPDMPDAAPDGRPYVLTDDGYLIIRKG
jgi:hypothetical protein